MVNLNDNEDAKLPKSGPITERKEYLSQDDGERRNSFRKYVLGVIPTKDQIIEQNFQSPPKEINEEHDESLLQELPASIKKLHQFSIDRSKHSIDVDAYIEENKAIQNEDNGDVGINLKFFNKVSMRSKNPQNILPKLNSTSKLSLKYPNIDIRKRQNSYYSPAQSNRDASK